MKKRLLLLLIPLSFILLQSAKKLPTYTIQDLTGDFNPKQHVAFRLVPATYAVRDMYLRKETAQAFMNMSKAAAKEGISLVLVSATRPKSRQVEIWEDKWQRYKGSDKEKALEILQYSSMPGTSRHHWGTDIDINSTETSYFESGRGEKEYEWLAKNAARFGFFQPYTKQGDERTAGYREEKWHWSYYPIADQMLRAYKRLISYDKINGFSGSELAFELNVIEQFVESIQCIEPYKKFDNQE